MPEPSAAARGVLAFRVMSAERTVHEMAVAKTRSKARAGVSSTAGSTGIDASSAGPWARKAVTKIPPITASITRASQGSIRAMPSCPRIARATTTSWHRTAKSIGEENPVAADTRASTARPASMACTQDHPIRTTTLNVTGNRDPRWPKAARVSAMVGRPVRAPMTPTPTRTRAPRTVPSTMLVKAVA